MEAIENQTLNSLRTAVEKLNETTTDKDVLMAYACGLAACNSVLEITHYSVSLGVFSGHVTIEDIRTGEELILESDADGTLIMELQA